MYYLSKIVYFADSRGLALKLIWSKYQLIVTLLRHAEAPLTCNSVLLSRNDIVILRVATGGIKKV